MNDNTRNILDKLLDWLNYRIKNPNTEAILEQDKQFVIAIREALAELKSLDLWEDNSPEAMQMRQAAFEDWKSAALFCKTHLDKRNKENERLRTALEAADGLVKDVVAFRFCEPYRERVFIDRVWVSADAYRTARAAIDNNKP